MAHPETAAAIGATLAATGEFLKDGALTTVGILASPVVIIGGMLATPVQTATADKDEIHLPQNPPLTSQAKSTTSPAVDQATKDRVKENAGDRCEYCGKKTTTTGQTARGEAAAGDEGQTDHYKPKSKGGTDDEENLVHACRDCNDPGGKGNADPTDPNDAAGQKWRLLGMEKPQPEQ